MDKFKQLVQTLQTKLIILIDDDFIPVTDVQEVVTYVCFMNSLDRELLLLKLRDIDDTLIEPLNKLIEKVNCIKISKEDIKIIEAGLITNLLTDRGYNKEIRLANEIIDTITKSEKRDIILNLSMMYGLRNKEATKVYDPFFLDSLKDKSIRLYRGLEVSEFDLFENEINMVNNKRKNKFPLLIIDKQISEGKNGEEIIRDLRSRNKINKFFSILFTSKDDERIKPTDIEGYFHIQLRKDDSKALEKVSEALALSAFASFFDQIYKYRKESLNNANQLVIESESGIVNMLYLADMAYAEGDTVFNVFNNWFDLLSDKKAQDIIHDSGDFDINFMIGLTKLINSNFISSIGGNGDLDNNHFHKEIKKLETYEIFNRRVNEFCSPPASGDIFEINGQLYMLAGQECDLVIRSNRAKVKRNEKLAELVKCDFKQCSQDSKVDSSEIRIVKMNHFEFDGKKGVLEVNLGSKDFFDFRIMDLCSLNKDGISRCPKNDYWDSPWSKLLPEKWTKYVPLLIEEIKCKIKVHDFLTKEDINPTSITGDQSFNIAYEKNLGGAIIFPVRRVARIKGQFREYLLQRYWQYKTRMGVNTIGLYTRTPVEFQSIRFGFPYDLKEITGDYQASLQLTGNRDKNKDKTNLDLILEKEYIASKLNGAFEQYVNSINTREIIIDNKIDENPGKYNYILFSKEWSGDKLSLTIKFPLFNKYANRYFIGKDSLTAYDLFGKEFIDINPNLKDAVFVNDSNKRCPLFPEGLKPHKMSLKNLLEGEIHIPKENIKLQFDKEQGRLLKTDS